MSIFSIIYLISMVMAIILGLFVLYYIATNPAPNYKLNSTHVLWGAFCVFCPIFNTLVVSTAILFLFQGVPRNNRL
jgi:hypothetical protein